ncbi:LexA family protein [Niallia sp. 03190]|uniref:LexA family protein n=1 Tax=Niallia sp. 03190 TaxID=3458061 RepID=UPI004044B8C9
MYTYYQDYKTKKERMLEKEQEIVGIIKEWMKYNKCPPTMRELTLAVGFKSPSTTYEYLIRMKNKGVLSWEEKKTRTLHLVETTG